MGRRRQWQVQKLRGRFAVFAELLHAVYTVEARPTSRTAAFYRAPPWRLLIETTGVVLARGRDRGEAVEQVAATIWAAIVQVQVDTAAAGCMACQAIAVNGLAGLRSTTTRDSCGTPCLKSSRRFPSNSAASVDSPVTSPHVAAWLREARHEASRHRIPSDRGDDRDRLGRLLGREGAGGAGREDDIRLETDKLLCEDCMTILLALSPLIPDDEILPLHVAELTEALQKGVDEAGFERGRGVAQIPNRHGAFGLLRRDGERYREEADGEGDDDPDCPVPHYGPLQQPSVCFCGLLCGDACLSRKSTVISVRCVRTSGALCVWRRRSVLFDGASARSARFGNLTILLVAPPCDTNAPDHCTVHDDRHATIHRNEAPPRAWWSSTVLGRTHSSLPQWSARHCTWRCGCNNRHLPAPSS